MKEIGRYHDGHWSTTKEADVSLALYLKQYESVYNKENINRLTKAASQQRSNILDYGGGCGMLAVSLAKIGHSVTLIDLSETAVETAKLFAKKEGVSILAYSVKEINFQKMGQLYDMIYAKDLIEHVEDDVALIKDLYSVLKPGGKIILTTQNNRSINYCLEAGLRKILKPHTKWMGWDRTHLRFYNPKLLKSLLNEVGIREVRFNSGYIIPYKLFSLIFKNLNPHKESLLSRLDRQICKMSIFAKIGWNIMIIGVKPKKICE